MAKMTGPENIPVWIDSNRCKACDLCVSLCPSGTLAMQLGAEFVLGKIARVMEPQRCIGCYECELHCPDFAIHVAERSDFKFAKLTPESKERAQQIKANRFMAL
ncbi:MAG: 4Fe-4S binding protein [Helicobacter sp.]|nr:4Fe-4S binding protein [Helicobacter sp.]MDE7316880.1 4Fe-4S binding protein [Helicobacter sp.]